MAISCLRTAFRQFGFFKQTQTKSAHANWKREVCWKFFFFVGGGKKGGIIGGNISNVKWVIVILWDTEFRRTWKELKDTSKFIPPIEYVWTLRKVAWFHFFFLFWWQRMRTFVKENFFINPGTTGMVINWNRNRSFCFFSSTLERLAFDTFSYGLFYLGLGYAIRGLPIIILS
jgi:hypothetical protein